MSTSNPILEITYSSHFLSWLQEQQVSLACTTYQTNRLFFISGQANGRLKVQERLFDKPMGLYAEEDRLYMTTRYQLWHFDNLLGRGEKYGNCDRLYVPRTAYTTGDLNAHEVVLDEAQNIIFVNTDFSCLATLSPDYSFVPLWQPPFISKLVPEDRCHLNGLAMVDGKPTYVTACSATDTAAGWRNCRSDGGVVINIESNEIIATGLSMPHSPRWYRGKLWLVNSGTGELGYLDGSQFVPITFCPGFVRGLAFWENFALVGLSKLRSPNFTGLALEKRLAAEGNTAHCGLMVIDLTNGQVVHWLHIGQTIEELFDVVILPGVRQPEALGLQGDELQRLVRFPNSGGIITTKPTVKRPSIGMTPIAGLPRQVWSGTDATPEHPESERVEEAPQSQNPKSNSPLGGGKGGIQNLKYQRVYHLNPSNALDYDDLTYPRLSQRWQKQPPRGELFGISAAVEGTMVGFVIAERLNAQTAEIISLLVLPEYRRRGIGTKLLAYLEREMRQQKCSQLTIVYQQSTAITTVVEPLLQKLAWQPPVMVGNQSKGSWQSLATNGMASADYIPPLSRVGEQGTLTDNSGKPRVQYRELQNLTKEQSLAYNELTFPKIQTRWRSKQPRGQLGGIVAEVSGQPVGLVLAEIFSPQPNQPLEGEIISLFVLPNYRHQGIGSGLIQNLEKELRTLGCEQMRVSYKSSPITALALEPLLKQQDWQPPQVNFFLGKTTTEKVCQAPWLRKYPLPERFSIFPWGELTDEDEQQIQTLNYPASLNPLGNTPAEPLNSLGLRYDGQLVGWMVTHRVAPDAIRYSTMFVEKRFQRLGRGISLLSQSILRQTESSVPYCLFAVAEDNPRMLQFVQRHLQPYLTEVTDSRVGVKPLKSQ